MKQIQVFLYFVLIFGINVISLASVDEKGHVPLSINSVTQPGQVDRESKFVYEDPVGFQALSGSLYQQFERVNAALSFDSVVEKIRQHSAKLNALGKKLVITSLGCNTARPVGSCEVYFGAKQGQQIEPYGRVYIQANFNFSENVRLVSKLIELGKETSSQEVRQIHYIDPLAYPSAVNSLEDTSNLLQGVEGFVEYQNAIEPHRQEHRASFKTIAVHSFGCTENVQSGVVQCEVYFWLVDVLNISLPRSQRFKKFGKVSVRFSKAENQYSFISMDDRIGDASIDWPAIPGSCASVVTPGS